jgi:hypothetical protein
MVEDPFVALAVVGTSRHGQVNPTTGTPVDPLLATLPDGEQERKLLLSAGARAIYLQAGQQAQTGPQLPAPAVPEKLPACSDGVALLLSRLLEGEQAELLPEALERLRQTGKRLPYHLLPIALAKRDKGLQALLFPVLGERGLWLGHLNSSWKWVQNFLPSETADLPDDAETLWQEGTPAQRVEVLRRLRTVDPAKAREWLAETWKRERAEVRVDMLATFESNLSAEDEDFLEKALDDRALSVRETAVRILPHLAEAAFAGRMRERGAAILQAVPGKKSKPTLQVSLPENPGDDWKRDGLSEKSPNNLGQRAWWMVQVLEKIPPAFWETQFALEPQALVAAIAKDEWATSVIDGWSRAAVTYRASNWSRPLWQWWETHPGEIKKGIVTNHAIRYDLLKLMEQTELEAIVLDAFQDIKKKKGQTDQEPVTYLSLLPTPWSEAFGFAFLRLLRANYTNGSEDLKNFHAYSNPWFNSLQTAARALLPACLEEAAQPWGFHEDITSWQAAHARDMLKNFTDTVHMRKKIYEEIG